MCRALTIGLVEGVLPRTRNSTGERDNTAANFNFKPCITFYNISRFIGYINKIFYNLTS